MGRVAERSDRRPLADRPVVRAAAVLVLSLLVAAGLAAVKGRWLDAAYVIGNSSAAYLLLPFLAGRLLPGRVPAIVLGIAATFVALLAFYFTASTLYLGRLSLDFSLGRWFLAGTASGAVFGLVGHAARRHSLLLYVVPAVLMLEPLAAALAAAVGIGSGAPVEALVVAGAVEAGLGLLTLVLVRLRRRRAVRL